MARKPEDKIYFRRITADEMGPPEQMPVIIDKIMMETEARINRLCMASGIERLAFLRCFSQCEIMGLGDKEIVLALQYLREQMGDDAFAANALKYFLVQWANIQFAQEWHAKRINRLKYILFSRINYYPDPDLDFYMTVRLPGWAISILKKLVIEKKGKIKTICTVTLSEDIEEACP